MSLLASRMDRVSRATDREFGEPFLFEPMTTGPDRNGPVIPDASRESRLVVGRWGDKTEPLNQADAYDQRSDKRPGVAGSRTTLMLCRQDWTESEPELWVRHRDHLVRQSDGVRYSIVTAVPSGRLRIRCDVNKLG